MNNYREVKISDLKEGNMLEIETPTGWFAFPYRKPRNGWELDWNRIEDNFNSYKSYLRIKI